MAANATLNHSMNRARNPAQAGGQPRHLAAWRGQFRPPISALDVAEEVLAGLCTELAAIRARPPASPAMPAGGRAVAHGKASLATPRRGSACGRTTAEGWARDPSIASFISDHRCDASCLVRECHGPGAGTYPPAVRRVPVPSLPPRVRTRPRRLPHRLRSCARRTSTENGRGHRHRAAPNAASR